MPPRTVLHITPSARLLGARRSLLQLVTNLDPSRYRPVVAAQSEGALLDALRQAGVETHVLPLGWWRKGRDMLLRPWRIGQLARLAARTGAHILHCNEFYPAPYAVRAAARAGGIPVVAHMRLSITPRQLRHYHLERVARIVCVSQAAARDFAPWPPEWRRRVEVIYNGVDLRAFAPPGRRDATRRHLGLAPDDFVAAQFALVSPRKRQHLLIEAAAHLRDRLPGLRVLIVGSPGKSDGPYAARLRRQVEERGLGDAVRFVDFTPDVAPLYEACDVNILVSNDEGFGRTPIEAGAMGIPSIGARVGGIPEVIADGETGTIVPADDDGSALARALADMAGDAERRHALGQAALRRARDTFSIERHVDRMMDLFDEVLRESKPDPA